MKKFSFIVSLSALFLTLSCSVEKSQEIDYSDPNNWVVCEKNPTHEVDAFYIYPTLVMDSETGVVDINDSTMRQLAPVVYKNQGYAIGKIANEYAPYYRQCSLNSLSDVKSNREICDSMKVKQGVKDLYNALDYYFENLNNGRPFILTGHSQGSTMIKLILAEYMKSHPEYLERMIAAYPLGFGFGKSYYEENPHLKYAKGETDTGVVISWNLEAPGATENNLLMTGDDVCINPLNWTLDDTYAPAEMNLDGKHDAQIDPQRGSVIVNCEEPYLQNNMFGDKSYHLYDWQFFYDNLTANAQKRIDAYFGR